MRILLGATSHSLCPSLLHLLQHFVRAVDALGGRFDKRRASGNVFGDEHFGVGWIEEIVDLVFAIDLDGLDGDEVGFGGVGGVERRDGESRAFGQRVRLSRTCLSIGQHGSVTSGKHKGYERLDMGSEQIRGGAGSEVARIRGELMGRMKRVAAQRIGSWLEKRHRSVGGRLASAIVIDGDDGLRGDGRRGKEGRPNTEEDGEITFHCSVLCLDGGCVVEGW